MANPYAMRYRKIALGDAVFAASPHQLVEMLLQAAVARIRLAINLIGSSDRSRKGKAIAEACDIIAHLDDSLDHDAGAELADNLSALYHYMLLHLAEGHARNDPGALQQALSLLERIESAWSTIAAQSPAAGQLAAGHA